MKPASLIAVVGALSTLPAANLVAQIWTVNWPVPPLVVPDGSLVGLSDTHWINDAAFVGRHIGEVRVTLELSGGWNGDLFAQLNHNSGFSVLLNRPGVSSSEPFGYGDPGFSVTFADSAANGDIHQ